MDASINTFGRLDRLLANRYPITLKPFRMGDAGYDVLLLPVSNGTALQTDGLNQSSLPALELELAGIDGQQHEEFIFEKVRKLLAGKTFTLELNFSPFDELNAVLDIFNSGDEFKHKIPTISEIAKAQSRKSIGFKLLDKGDPVPGLDLGRFILGEVAGMNGFVIQADFMSYEYTKAIAAGASLKQQENTQRELVKEFLEWRLNQNWFSKLLASVLRTESKWGRRLQDMREKVENAEIRFKGRLAEIESVRKNIAA